MEWWPVVDPGKEEMKKRMSRIYVPQGHVVICPMKKDHASLSVLVPEGQGARRPKPREDIPEDKLKALTVVVPETGGAGVVAVSRREVQAAESWAAQAVAGREVVEIQYEEEVMGDYVIDEILEIRGTGSHMEVRVKWDVSAHPEWPEPTWQPLREIPEEEVFRFMWKCTGGWMDKWSRRVKPRDTGREEGEEGARVARFTSDGSVREVEGQGRSAGAALVDRNDANRVVKKVRVLQDREAPKTGSFRTESVMPIWLMENVDSPKNNLHIAYGCNSPVFQPIFII